MWCGWKCVKDAVRRVEAQHTLAVGINNLHLAVGECQNRPGPREAHINVIYIVKRKVANVPRVAHLHRRKKDGPMCPGLRIYIVERKMAQCAQGCASISHLFQFILIQVIVINPPSPHPLDPGPRCWGETAPWPRSPAAIEWCSN